MATAPTHSDNDIDIPLIPRTVLFGNPDRASARISPDGSHLSYLAPDEGVLNVWVAPADNPDAAEPVTHDRVRGIRMYYWAQTARHILYAQDEAGDENWRIYAVDLETDEETNLTPLEQVRAEVQHISKDYPQQILVGLNDRDPQYHDIYRIDISTGERELIQENDGFAGFITDDDLHVRFATRMIDDGSMEILRPAEDEQWQPYASIPREDTMSTHVIDFDKSGEHVYMIDSRDRDTAALTRMNVETQQREILAESSEADIVGALMHPTEKHPQAARSNYTRAKWQVIDEAIAEDMEYLRSVADGDVEVVSRSLDDDSWIVVYIVDDGPVRYYVYDRPEREAQFLFTNRRELEGLPLAEMHPTVIKSRDDLDLVSYLTLPPWEDTDADGRPEKPLSMVLNVHGGPWARDSWGYDPNHQWLANRGHAVMSVNFRGSTGFGKSFINASTFEWGAKMHEDLIDAVNWAIDEGIADPDRIAIMGGSFGGYATLVGLTFTPDVFACGVDIVGPSNLVTLLQTIPPYWAPMKEMFRQYVGDVETEEGRELLASRSPLTYADRIKKPLLIAQGANDPRVKQAESDQIVQAMQEKGIPVTYVLYTDEGHGFARPENRLSFYAIAEAFLAEQLGGRFQAIEEAFEGANIEVPTGAEEVPGLPEALDRTGEG